MKEGNENIRETIQTEIESFLRTHPNGVPLIDISNKTGMTYGTIEKHAIALGYTIKKERVIRERPVLVIKRKEE